VSRLLHACACCTLVLSLSACVSTYERGEKLYTEGDVAGALQVWRRIPESSSEYPRAHARLETVQGELESSLQRYEKRAQFFEGQGRLAEAVLYYRLALKLDPDRPATLARVQKLFRQLHTEEAAERKKLATALAVGKLGEARQSADRLERLDPFDPGIQIEVRQVNAEIGAQVLRSLEDGKRAYANGDRAGASAAFARALELEPDNEAALGYLSYIKRYDEEVAEENRQRTHERVVAKGAPPPPAVSAQEILAEGHFRAGQQAEDAGDPYRALQEYVAALEVDPRHAGAKRQLGTLRAELAPRVPVLYEQGKHYFQEEDLEKALAAWRDALLIAPDDQRTKENVDRAERILSRLEEIQTHGP